MKTALLTALALVAFAANSLLCRAALAEGAIDPYSFTTIRLASGALTLWLVLLSQHSHRDALRHGSWPSAMALFVYALGFSLAYGSLSAGTGALTLFAAAQLTLLTLALRAREPFDLWRWLGFIVAAAGLVYLFLPGIEAPNTQGLILMTAAGIAWGAYTARGRATQLPIRETTGNFLRATPFVIATSVLAASRIQLAPQAIALAIASGALASGLGYVIWYQALRDLTRTQAAASQLLTPVIAALGGVALLGAKPYRLASSSPPLSSSAASP